MGWSFITYTAKWRRKEEARRLKTKLNFTLVLRTASNEQNEFQRTFLNGNYFLLTILTTVAFFVGSFVRGKSWFENDLQSRHRCRHFQSFCQ